MKMFKLYMIMVGCALAGALAVLAVLAVTVTNIMKFQ
jgi:hypothetical protein